MPEKQSFQKKGKAFQKHLHFKELGTVTKGSATGLRIYIWFDVDPDP